MPLRIHSQEYWGRSPQRYHQLTLHGWWGQSTLEGSRSLEEENVNLISIINVARKILLSRGIFQDDLLSPLVFILCFDPNVQFLKLNSTFGYDLDGKPIITTPFADDFCLITHNKRSHQRLINEIDHHIKSRGLRIKPSKCRSLSLSSGKYVDVEFRVGEDQIYSVGNEIHKFLGAVITKNLASSDIHEYLSNKIEKCLENIDSSAIRNELKVKVYTRYILPYLRFDLTVNDMTHTHCKSLDSLTNRYLKKWCGLPRPGTLHYLLFTCQMV